MSVKSVVLVVASTSLSAFGFAVYSWFAANYIILSKTDATAVFMLVSACLGGGPSQ